jgi:transcriptional regulator with XRE-family HTH domain
MRNRFENYIARKMKNAEFKRLVDDEIAALKVGTQIAKLRQRAGLTQTQLAALAGMSAPKISDIERSARNVTFATIVRIASALGSRVDINFKSHKIPRPKSRAS